jgi:asparagine synthase (glutamine-hydrolysing)
MGQIFGLGGMHDAGELQRAVFAMAEVTRRPHQPPPACWLDATVGVAFGHIPDSAASSTDEGRGDTAARLPLPCVLDGVFYRGTPAEVAQPEAYLLAGYAELGDDLLEQLDGSFSFALYLRDQHRLIVANDRFSSRTLYWTQSAGRLAFASELKTLLAVPGLPVELDHATLAQCAGFNRILGHGTLVRNVSRFPGATILQWNEPSGAHLRQYWQLGEAIAQRRQLTPERRDEIVETFRDAVRIRASRSAPVGISLSGGVDSRAIAAVIDADGIQAISCTTGFAGSADQRLAAQVARIAGTDHHFFQLTREAISDYPQALRSAAFVRDELLLGGGFPGRLLEQFCVTFGIRTLLRGHGGENLKLAEAWPFQVTPAVLQMRSPEELGRHLRRGLASCPPDVDLDRLLPGNGKTSVSHILDAAVADAIAIHPGLTAAEVMSALYLVQNDGIEVPLTRNGLRGRAEMALPFIDYRLLDLVLSTRVPDRCDTGIHAAILQRLSPRMLAVGNSNTGAPVDASWWRLYVTDKANTLLRRLRVPGFRHYHYMEHWLQGFLAEQVRAIVLDERTLRRGIFPPKALADLMARAHGDTRMSRLVNFVMNVEIWCRLFIDREDPRANSDGPAAYGTTRASV